MDDATLCERTEGLLLRNPQIANQFDLTAISLPMPAMELPAGIMLIAPHGDDRRLLAIAAAVETAFLRIGQPDGRISAAPYQMLRARERLGLWEAGLLCPQIDCRRTLAPAKMTVARRDGQYEVGPWPRRSAPSPNPMQAGAASRAAL